MEVNKRDGRCHSFEKLGFGHFSRKQGQGNTNKNNYYHRLHSKNHNINYDKRENLNTRDNK